MKLIGAFLALLAIASAKNRPKLDWHGGMLVEFRTIQIGSSCRSDGNATARADGAGQATAGSTANSDCRALYAGEYTVRVDTHTYVLRPRPVGRKAALSLIPFAGVFAKNSVLYGQPPGSRIEIALDGVGVVVRIGDRESTYSVVASH